LIRRIVPGWQQRRSQFNHDWLKNEFLNNLDGFIVMLQYEKPCDEHLATFIENDFLSWQQHFEEGKTVIDSFETEMTPATLLNKRPLSSADPSTREWMGWLVHNLWLCRYEVKENISDLSDLYEKAGNLYKTIKTRLDETGKSPEELKKLLPEFRDFRQICFEFSKKLSTLPSEVKYA